MTPLCRGYRVGAGEGKQEEISLGASALNRLRRVGGVERGVEATVVWELAKPQEDSVGALLETRSDSKPQPLGEGR